MREGGGSSTLCCADFPPFHRLKINSVQFTGLSEKKRGGRERERRGKRKKTGETNKVRMGGWEETFALWGHYEVNMHPSPI